MKPKTAKPGAALPPLPDSAYPADAKPIAVSPASTFRAELTSGPTEMSFCGRQWKRGQPQTITAEERRAMLERGAERLGFTLTKENDHV